MAKSGETVMIDGEEGYLVGIDRDRFQVWYRDYDIVGGQRYTIGTITRLDGPEGEYWEIEDEEEKLGSFLHMRAALNTLMLVYRIKGNLIDIREARDSGRPWDEEA